MSDRERGEIDCCTKGVLLMHMDERIPTRLIPISLAHGWCGAFARARQAIAGKLARNIHGGTRAASHSASDAGLKAIVTCPWPTYARSLARSLGCPRWSRTRSDKMAPASDSPQLRARTSTKLEEQFATRRIHTPAANDEIDNHDLATHPYSTPRRRNVLLFCLGFRAVLALVGQKTFFQPDEFYQSLEPAHRLVWGTGYETWEWRGSPLGDVRRRQGPIEIPLVVDHDEIKSVPLKKESRANLRDYITQSPILAKLLLGSSNDDLPVDSDEAGSRSLNGLLRSWVWPLLFALPYWVLKVTGLDKVGPLLVSARKTGVS